MIRSSFVRDEAGRVMETRLGEAATRVVTEGGAGLEA
jgi:hypothetical protein